MSIPKHDPGLAKFITSLDPSMYSISGGESPSAPVAKEVEGLRNDLESRYRETQIREGKQRVAIHNEEEKYRAHPAKLQMLDKMAKRIETDNKFRKSSEYSGSALQMQDSLSDMIGFVVVTAFGIFVLSLFIYWLKV